MAENSDLLNKFRKLPRLNSKPLKDCSFTFPELERDPQKTSGRGVQRVEVAALKSKTSTEGKGAIEQVLAALGSATSKLEFAKTSTTEWNSTLVYSGSRVKRDARNKTFRVTNSKKAKWAPGTPVNVTRSTAEHWFKEHLIHGILAGGRDRHEHVVVGAQGCGKSTIIKYLLSEHSEYIRNRKVVFSRFEFLKYWNDWHPNSPSRDEALADYLSFIHSRDLILDRFFDFTEGNRFKLKFLFGFGKNLSKELNIIASEISRLNPQIGGIDQSDPDSALYLITEAVEKAQRGNKTLMQWLSGLSVSTRILLVGALWDDRVLVTIFDGLDSLRVEDAFQATDQWEMVCHIVSNRRNLASPTILRTQGIAKTSDSLLVIRRNTAKFLEIEFDGRHHELGLSHYYHVAEIDGLLAILSSCKRALRLIPSISETNEKEFNELLFDFMRVFQRTFVAVTRGHGSSVNHQMMYNFFDGNLRHLFEFISRIIEWTISEMLPGEFLDSSDYFGTPAELISAMASEKGNEFLRRKSYRVVDLLLSEPGASFENAAGVTVAAASVLRRRVSDGTVRGNPDHTGFVDNLLNYIDLGHQTKLDDHALLEKLRVIQLLDSNALSWDELSKVLSSEFGYKPKDIDFLITFLMKTDLVTAQVVRSHMQYNIVLKATSRGQLLVSSLFENLSYLEQIFHRTLFPRDLIAHVKDKPRSEGSIEWAAVSIRNAFILLAYLKLIEENRANNKKVPDRNKVLKRISDRVIRSIDRMTTTERRNKNLPPLSDHEKKDARRIIRDALSEIEKTEQSWRALGLLPASN